MNISESNDLNTLLQWLLRGRLPDRGSPARWRHPGNIEARDAAARLAEKAYKALSAGVSGRDVAEAWVPQVRNRNGKD